MRRAALLSVFLVALVSAGEGGDVATLPTNPLARAREGDWARWSVTTGKRRAEETWRVVKVRDDLVEVTVEREGAPARRGRLSKARAPTLEEVLCRPRTLTLVRTSEETRSAEGQEHACARLEVSDDEHDGVAWIASDVPSGIVALRLTPKGGRRPAIEYELVAHGGGSGDDAKWVKPGTCEVPDLVKAHGGMNCLAVEWTCPRCSKRQDGLQWTLCEACCRELDVCLVCNKKLAPGKKRP